MAAWMAAFASALVGSARAGLSANSIAPACWSEAVAILRCFSLEPDEFLRLSRAAKLVRDSCFTSDLAAVEGLPPGPATTTSLADFSEALESEVRRVEPLLTFLACTGEPKVELELTETDPDEVDVDSDEEDDDDEDADDEEALLPRLAGVDEASEFGDTDVVDGLVVGV